MWCLLLGLPALSMDGKLFANRPRLSNDSYDKYMAWTELLT